MLKNRCLPKCYSLVIISFFFITHTIVLFEHSIRIGSCFSTRPSSNDFSQSVSNLLIYWETFKLMLISNRFSPGVSNIQQCIGPNSRHKFETPFVSRKYLFEVRPMRIFKQFQHVKMVLNLYLVLFTKIISKCSIRAQERPGI